MAWAICADCGREYKARAPSTCRCGHNIAADVAAALVVIETAPAGPGHRYECGDCGVEYPGGAPPVCTGCGHNILTDPEAPDPCP